MNPLKVYVASSWRNDDQPAVVKLCREIGFEVYDFKNPPNRTGFSWSQIDPNWKNWTIDEYLNALQTPLAVEGFDSDMNALIECDICILVFPAGVSAAMEFGQAVGAGKYTFVIGIPRGADLMVRMGDHYCRNMEELKIRLKRLFQANLVAQQMVADEKAEEAAHRQ